MISSKKTWNRDETTSPYKASIGRRHVINGLWLNTFSGCGPQGFLRKLSGFYWDSPGLPLPVVSSLL